MNVEPWKRMPRNPDAVVPVLMSCGTRDSIVARGIANPIPADWPSVVPSGEWFVAIAVLIPTSRPWISTSGPPEFPGLMGASV